MNLDLAVVKKSTIKKYTGHLLAEELGAYVRASRRPNSRNNTLINWGRSSLESLDRYRWILNHPMYVKLAIDKLVCLQVLTLNNVKTLEYTSNINIATVWTIDTTIMCRTLLSSNSGKGIVVATSPGEVVPAPLYTRYFDKTIEQRIHVFNGEVLDVQQKKKLSSESLVERELSRDSFDPHINNTKNGYIFARQDITHYDDVHLQCVRAVQALGLDFGAVDVLIELDGDKAYVDCAVCEVNTAPGLEGTTFERYVSAFKKYIEDNL